MNELSDRDFIVAVEGWLDEGGPRVAPDRLVDQVLLHFPDERRHTSREWIRMAMVAVAASLITLAIVTLTLVATRQVGPPSTPAPALRCPPATPACGNPLSADVSYTSANFRQPVTFEVPTAIWTASTDEPWGFVMNLASDPRQVIGLYLAPGATDASGRRLAGADASAAALIGAWRANAEIAVGTTVTTTLLGEAATYVEIQPSSSGTTVADACGEDLVGLFCMPIMEAASGELRSDLYVAFAGHYRVYLLEHGGALLAVTLEAKHDADFAQLEQLAAPVLANLRFAH